MKKIPEVLQLKGQTILLRTPSVDDWKSLRPILSDPKTMRNLRYMAYLPAGWSERQVKERLSSQLNKQKTQNGLFFMVTTLSDGRIAGSCSFTTLDLTHQKASFGLIIHHPFWGTSIASECHFLVLRYGFEVLGLHRVEFTTSPNNLRMLKFFDKIGIAQEGIKKDYHLEEGQFRDSIVLALSNRDWSSVKHKLEARIKSKIG